MPSASKSATARRSSWPKISPVAAECRNDLHLQAAGRDRIGHDRSHLPSQGVGTGDDEPFDVGHRKRIAAGRAYQGSLVLVAHHVDATFGDVQVRDLSAVSPLVSPASGTYSGLTTVSMATDIAGSTIRYTLNGAEPTEQSPAYTEPFLINQTTTVKAKTFQTGFDPSPTTTRFYEIVPAESSG